MTASGLPPSLLQLLTKRVTVVTFASICLLTCALLFLLHHSIHEQTDALLVRLAEEDALSVHHDPEGAHLHDTSIAAPTLQATVVDKYAMILNDACDIVARTNNMPHPVFPASICPDDHPIGSRTVMFLDTLADVPLRVAIAYERGPDGAPAAFVVGVNHHDVDASTWRVAGFAVPLALLAAFLIVFALWLATRPLVRELETLSDAVELLNARDPLHSLATAIEAIERTPKSSEETAILATALSNALKEMQTAAEQRARFIAEASHELRTPITAMRGELEVTLRRERDAAAYREALGIALDNAMRLQGLTEHLLEASRADQQRSRLDAIDLRDAVADALRSRAAILQQAGVTAEFSPPPAPVLGRAEHQLAVRVIANLLDNVCVHAHATTVSVQIRDEGKVIRVVVSDDGRGIQAEALVDLFEPFGRTTDSRGHGLGLYLVRTLMRAQGGNVQWRGPGLHGRGASFELVFLRP